MEEEKAAAYYDELTRKGEGAARFKQGLGFSTSANSDVVPKAGSALVSSSSFLSNFVRASSPSKASEFDKQEQLQSIQNKLKKKPTSSEPSRVSEKSHKPRSLSREGDKDRDSSRRRSRSRERRRGRDRELGRRSRSRERYRERDRDSRRRSRSRERYRDRDADRRRRRRSRSRSASDGERPQRGRGRSRSISPREGRSDKRSRSSSPQEQRRSEKNESDIRDRRRVSKMGKDKKSGVDFARLIQDYDKMSPAERVKAKMKLQLSETAEKDSEKDLGWERFEFNKDAPLDDEEIEVAEDDASLVKHIGQSFRFSAVEARREEQIQAAHEEAMFGSSALPPPIISDSEPERESNEKEVNRKDLVTSLLSESVLATRKGSWRDRVREA